MITAKYFKRNLIFEIDTGKVFKEYAVSEALYIVAEVGDSVFKIAGVTLQGAGIVAAPCKIGHDCTWVFAISVHIKKCILFPTVRVEISFNKVKLEPACSGLGSY